MIVEDDSDIRELVREFLEMEGYPVVTFDDGHKALASLVPESLFPRAILLDWRMPAMSGKEFLEAYNLLPDSLPKSPVYIFSAEHDQRLAGTVGCAGIIKKPVEFDHLLAILQGL